MSTISDFFLPMVRLLQFGGIAVPMVQDEDSSDRRGHVLLKIRNYLHRTYCLFFNAILWIYSGRLFYKLLLLELYSSEWNTMFVIATSNGVAALFNVLANIKHHNGMLLHLINEFGAYEDLHEVNPRTGSLAKRLKRLQPVVIIFTLKISFFLVWACNRFPAFGDAYFLFRESHTWVNLSLAFINFEIELIVVFKATLIVVMGFVPLCGELDILNKRFQALTRAKNVTPVKKVCGIQQLHVNHTEAIRNLDTFSGSEDRHVVVNQEKSRRVRALIGQHQHLCNLISGFSNVCSNIVLSTFFISLPLCCFLCYLILTQTKLIFDTVMSFVVLGVCLLFVTVSCYTGAAINIKAHKPLQYIWDIETSDLDEGAMRDMTMFSLKLTGTSIGYSVYGFFTISMPTVLTIVGTMVTYFVVVLQFQGRGSDQCSINHPDITQLLQLVQNSSIVW